MHAYLGPDHTIHLSFLSSSSPLPPGHAIFAWCHDWASSFLTHQTTTAWACERTACESTPCELDDLAIVDQLHQEVFHGFSHSTCCCYSLRCYSFFPLLKPGDPYNGPDASVMEHTQTSYALCFDGPCFSSIQKYKQDCSPVHFSLCLNCNSMILKDCILQETKGPCSLADAALHFITDLDIVRDVAPKVREVFDNLNLSINELNW